MSGADTADVEVPDGFKLMTRPGGFEELIGPIYGRKDSGDQYRLAFRAAPHHTNPQGVIHGGMMMTVLDATLGIAVYRVIGKKRCATISLNCNFVASGQVGDWLETTATIVRRGRSVVFMRGELMCGDRLLMTGDGVWKVMG